MRLRFILLVLFSVIVCQAQRAPHLDPATDIEVAFIQGQLRVAAPEGVHLNCAFMDVKLQKGTPGRLKVGPLPPATAQDEAGQGIWRGPVLVPLRGTGLKGEVALTITYQPCTEGRGGVCYPPTDRVLKVQATEIPPLVMAEKAKVEEVSKAPVPAVLSPPAVPATPAAGVAPVPQPAPTQSRGLFWVFLGVFGAGLLASLTPCVFPMIPITLAIIGAKGAGKAKGLALSAMLVLGMATTYTVLGVVAARAGAAFGAFAQRPAFLIPVAIIFVIFAMSLFGAFELQLPDGLRSRLQGSGPRRGYLGAYVMGLVLGPLSAPCVGPVIGTVLVAIAQEGKVLLGALQLFTFALGMGVLFLVVGTSSAALPRSGPWLEKLKQGLGILVLGFAFWSVRLIVPEWVNLALASLVLFLVAAVLEVFGSAEGLLPSLRKGLGWLALAVALLLGVRAVEIGMPLALLPRATSAPAPPPAQQVWLQQDFEGALAKAKAGHKLVLVDTFAQWCAQCKELDEKTWPDAQVQDWILRNAVAVRIDADAVRPDLGEKLKIVGFPTVLLLDAEGHELRRLMGFQKPAEMLAFLEGR